jgi:hypothetical protein
MKGREVTFLIVSLILAAVLGGMIGDVIGHFLPDGGAKILLSTAYPIGFKTVTVDFFAISFTIGLTFKINAISFLFVLLVIIYFRYWYI